MLPSLPSTPTDSNTTTHSSFDFVAAASPSSVANPKINPKIQHILAKLASSTPSYDTPNWWDHFIWFICPVGPRLAELPIRDNLERLLDKTIWEPSRKKVYPKTTENSVNITFYQSKNQPTLFIAPPCSDDPKRDRSNLYAFLVNLLTLKPNFKRCLLPLLLENDFTPPITQRHHCLLLDIHQTDSELSLDLLDSNDWFNLQTIFYSFDPIIKMCQDAVKKVGITNPSYTNKKITLNSSTLGVQSILNFSDCSRITLYNLAQILLENPLQEEFHPAHFRASLEALDKELREPYFFFTTQEIFSVKKSGLENILIIYEEALSHTSSLDDEPVIITEEDSEESVVDADSLEEIEYVDCLHPEESENGI